MRHRLHRLAPRPSPEDEMVASQHQLLHSLERDCNVTRSLFLNTSHSWADTFLVQASQLTKRSLGRYRLDFDMNTAGIQELWFDLETDGPKLKTKAWVQQHWQPLRDCALRLVNMLCTHLPEDCVYVTASGTGLHIRAFVRGINSPDHRDALLYHLLDRASIENSKGDKRTGCDYPSTFSIRKKVRSIGAPNADKRYTGKADYTHYCTWTPTTTLRTLRGYPFCADTGKVQYPLRYRFVDLPGEWRLEALPRRVIQKAVKRNKPQPTEIVCSQKPTRPLSDFWVLVKKDGKLKDLFYGKVPIVGLKDQSRSGREQSIVCKLVWYGFTFEQVDEIMRESRIGKWLEGGEEYRVKTHLRARNTLFLSTEDA